MPIEHAHLHGPKCLGVADDTPHRQNSDLDTTAGHFADAFGPFLLDMEVLDPGRIRRLELEIKIGRHEVHGKCSREKSGH